MSGRISGELGKSQTHGSADVRGPVTTDVQVDGGAGNKPVELNARPAPTGAAASKRRLDSGGVRIVLEGAGAQIERGLRELAKDRPSWAQVSPALRAALKQLVAVGNIDGDTRPALTELSGLAHRLLTALIGKDPEAIARQLGAVPKELSDRVADGHAPFLFEEIGRTSPIGASALGALMDLTGQSPAIMRELARMYPGAEAFGGIDALGKKLDDDLGTIKTEITALMRDRKIAQPNIDAFFRAFAEVRQGFEVGAAKGDDFQRTNWVHTRIEVLHTLQAAAERGLSPELSLAAALGALVSDSFKDGSTFSLLWHNRGGAELVLPLLYSRHFGDSGKNKTLLEDARRVALEHQITPPIFMSGAMKFFVGPNAAGVDEIVKKINEPNAAPQKGGEIVFSEPALESLRAKGIPGWSVLEPGSRHYLASLAAIVGDVLQYPGLDGVTKYALDIRDPEEPRAFMRDKLIKDAVNSSLEFSFSQGIQVVEDPALKKMALEYQERQKQLINERVYPEVDRRLRAELKVGPEALIPYWNEPVEAPLEEKQRALVNLVKRTLGAVASELGDVPLDPFGHRRAS